MAVDSIYLPEQAAMTSIPSTIRVDMKLVAEACSGEEAIEKFQVHRSDVTLMDLQMPGLNGIEATLRIVAEFPDARIIVLTTYSGDAQVKRALRAGARAYILKGHDRELIETIHAVMEGRKRMAPEVAAELAEHAMDDELSAREIEVLRLIASGNSNTSRTAENCQTSGLSVRLLVVRLPNCISILRACRCRAGKMFSDEDQHSHR